jgi:hypothetical protein
MPRTRKRRIIHAWTPADLKTLRRHARRTPVSSIARELKRSESAVRQKASSLRVSLRLR